MSKVIKVAIVLLVCLGVYQYIGWCSRPDNGIHALGNNVCLLEGECIVINWDATEHEVELALRKWQALKK